MNSLLQQFFNINVVREGLLATPDNPHYPQEESYLYQIKNIFASLKASDRKYHNPKDFTSIFKNYDNQIMNVGEQMDVDEFYNLLIDRLEPYMKNSPFENIFKYAFSGTISNEVIGRNECKHYSERKEVFQSIILQVKNKKTIEESLDAFIQGEMMEGENSYNCEKCEKKVPALKRQCFKKLPRVLVLVLKRFEYDYDTMQKNKINDYCEFPLELNMEKFTQEYLSKKQVNETTESSNNLMENGISGEEISVKIDNNNYFEDRNTCYNYDLTGIIIHTGTTERGHYYSFAKKSKDLWLEFNDTNVSVFDLEDLEDEAFGGTQFAFNNKTGKTEEVEKSTNAYVLFYTRKDVVEEEENVKNLMDIENNSHSKENQEKQTFLNLLRNCGNFSNIQDKIIENIKIDNFQYWVSKMIFSTEYYDFVKDVMLNYNSNFSNIYNVHIIAKNEFNNLLSDEILTIYENQINQIPKSNKSSDSSNLNFNNLNLNSKSYINLLNCGSCFKLDKFNFDNVRVRRFKKLINNCNKNSQIVDTYTNLDVYYKKLLDLLTLNSNINSNLIISNLRSNKLALANSLSLENKNNLSDNSLSNLIPDEREIFSTQENLKIIKKEKKNCDSIIHLIQMANRDLNNFNLFKFISTVFFTTIIRSKDKNLILPFVDIIKTNINLNIRNAAWIIEEFSNVELISEFLIDCPMTEMRRLTSGIIYIAILKICKNPHFENLKKNASNNFTDNKMNKDSQSYDFEIINIEDANEKENKENNGSETEDINDYNQSVENFIFTILNLTARKNKFPSKDFNTLYYLLWRYAGIGLKQKELLINSGLLTYTIAIFRIRNKFVCELNPEEEIKTPNLRPPKHNDMLNKKPVKIEKLTLFEELIEKRQADRIGAISDSYLFLTFIEILSGTNYHKIIIQKEMENTSQSQSNMALDNNDEFSILQDNVNINNNSEELISLTENLIKFINIENQENFRMFAFEANKNRLGIVYFSNLITKFSFNNQEYSEKIFNLFFENFINYDFDDISMLMRIFRNFISINDNYSDLRVNYYYYFYHF